MLIPLAISQSTNPQTGESTYSNRQSIIGKAFWNNYRGQYSPPMEFEDVGLFRNGEHGEAVYVELESGLILEAFQPAGQTISAVGAYEASQRQITKPTGHAEFDNWNRLLREGHYLELLVGQSGIGQHTVLVAGGAKAIPAAQGRQMHDAVRAHALAATRAVATQGPKVYARGEVAGQTFNGTNQEHRSAAASNPFKGTLIQGYIDSKAQATGRTLPNGTMATAHAEVEVIQKAHEAGITVGAALVIDIWGQAPCGYCTSHLAIAAEAAAMRQMTVNDIPGGKTYLWTPGMRNLGPPVQP